MLDKIAKFWLWAFGLLIPLSIALHALGLTPAAKNATTRDTGQAAEPLRPAPTRADVDRYATAMRAERDAWAVLWLRVRRGAVTPSAALDAARAQSAQHYGHVRVPFDIPEAIQVYPERASVIVACRTAAIMVKYALVSMSNTGRPDEPVAKIEESLARCADA